MTELGRVVDWSMLINLINDCIDSSGYFHKDLAKKVLENKISQWLPSVQQSIQVDWDKFEMVLFLVEGMTAEMKIRILNAMKEWQMKWLPPQGMVLDEERVKAELQLRYFKLMFPGITESDAEIVAGALARHIVAKFSLPQIVLPERKDILKRSPDGNYRDGYNAYHDELLRKNPGLGEEKL